MLLCQRDGQVTSFLITIQHRIFMRFTLFKAAGLLACTIAICSCNKTKSDESTLRGHYINQSFLESSKDSVPGTINTYCYELDFVSDDSVKVFYGFEEAMLAYAKSGKKYAIKAVFQDKDLLFSISEDHKLMLEDSVWKQSDTHSVFQKADSTSSGQWNFPAKLNEVMIARSYEIFEKGKATGQKVTFSPDGKVTGLGDFTSYEVCFSGDCVGEVHPVSNNITLSSGSINSVYAFQYNPAESILNIYNIEAPIPDIKGERAIKTVAYELHY